MQATRAVVFANGEFNHQDALYAGVSNTDLLVCVDGGVRHCLSESLFPHLLVGDSDSLDDESAAAIETLNIQRIAFPPEKDASDLELTLLQLEKYPLEEVVVLGASGGRTDHHLFNWQLFGSRSWSYRLRIIDGYVDARVVDSARSLEVSTTAGQLFSVVPVAVDATGVTLSGAKYPLNKATIKPGSTLGLSNVVSDRHLQVSVESGIVLVMLVHAPR